MTRKTDITRRSLSALALSGALLMTGGLSIATTAVAPSEAQVLATLAHTGVRATLTDLSRTGGDLASAVGTLCAQPDETTLAQAREAWRAAYLSWRRAEPFLFGPVKALGLERRIGVWPPNIQVLEGAVTSSDLAPLLRTADTRGYAATEFLLFVPSDARTATADRRCAHLLDASREIAELTARAPAVWEADYERRFLAAGDGEPFLTPGDALSLPIASALNVTERMLRDRIGPASGIFEGEPDLQWLDGRHSDSARAGLGASLEGLRLMLVEGETDIASLVATRDGVLSRRDPQLAASLERQIAKSIAALGEDERALPDRLKRLYREVERLQQQLVEVSLVLELDVLPTNAPRPF